ncbi:MAG: S-layer homology domain-containing protein [Candidatus Aquicultor sp.]
MSRNAKSPGRKSVALGLKMGIAGLALIALFSQVALAGTWQTQILESTTGDVGRHSSIALDSSGEPCIAYYDSSETAIKYKYKDSDGWHPFSGETIDNTGAVGEYASLAIDESDTAHVSYYDTGNANLKYAIRDNSGHWNPEPVESHGSMAGLYTSIAVDKEKYPHISYYDATSEDLKYAYKDGAEWQIETVDGTDSVGKYSAIAIDNSTGTPIIHISYYDETNHNLKYAYKVGNRWHIETVDNTGDTGKYTSIALDGAGKAHVSYYDTTKADLRYAYRNPIGFWQRETVDTETANVGEYSSITCDMSEMPHISYYDVANGNLKYTYKDARGWHVEKVDGDSNNVGEYTSIARDASNNIHISYYDVTNGDLGYAYKDNKQPTIGGTSPENGDTDTPVGQDIKIFFSEPIKKSTHFDDIRVTDLSGASPSIARTIKDNILTIKVTNGLNYNSNYKVDMPADAVTDISDNNLESAAPYSFSFKTELPADTVPPVTSIAINGTMGTNGWYKSNTPSVTLSTTEPATIHYFWDSDEEATATSPLTLSTTESAHTLYYYSIDTSGNREVPTQSKEIKVDTISPRTEVTATPEFPDGTNGWYKTAPEITLSASEPATFYYQWDSRDETMTTGTVKLPESKGTLAEGSHDLYYWAVDEAGNTEGTKASPLQKNFKWDITAPTTTMTVNPASPDGIDGWYKNTTPTVSFMVDERHSAPAIVHYKWDGSAETSVSGDPEANISIPVPEGIHTITYHSLDQAGNTEVTRTATLKVDAMPPTVPQITAVSTLSAMGVSEVAISGTSDTSTIVFIKATDNDTEVTTTIESTGTFNAELDLTKLKDGQIKISAQAVDEAGNTSAFCNAVTKTKDTVLPTSNAIISPFPPDGENGWFKTVPTITLTRSEPGATFYSWTSSSGPWMTYSTALSVPETTSGTLYYYSVDTIGNTKTVQNLSELKVDATAPGCSIVAPSDGATLAGNVSFTVSASDTLSDVSEVLFYMDGSSIETFTVQPYSLTLDTTRYSNFGHTLKARAYDNAGNFSESQINVSIANTTAPSAFTDGTHTTVSPGLGTTMTFDTVTAEGTTTISIASTAPPIPSGFQLVGNFYEVTTTAQFTGDILVTFPYDPSISAAEEATLKLRHWQAGAWIDVTYSKDTIAKTITGLVSSLSPFAVVKQPVVSSPPSSGGGGSSPTPQDQAPATPQGLKLVTNLGLIQLAWDANKEADLAGYRVYRIMGDGGPDKPSKVTPLATMSITQYNDTTANKGIVYTYYVTAVDKAGNESAPASLETALAEVAAEVTFSDVPSNAWYKEHVSKLVTRKVLGGYPDGTFRPGKAVSRVEFAKMICLAMGWDLANPAKPSFSDVSKQSWEYSYVETAKAHGAISGYPNGTFAPGRSITRAEIASILAKALKLSGGTSTLIDINTSWAKGYVNSCVKAGLISGYPNRTFKPNGYATRAEAAKLIAGLVK